MFFDIHTHILPGVDDGAADINESIKILTVLKKQGITHVMATPHFYPQEDDFESFLQRTTKAYNSLISAIKGKNLPNVYLGCEMLYCRWAVSSELIHHFCLSNSDHILIELTDYDIDKKFFVDMIHLKMAGYEPIIAHAERYSHAPNFRKFLKFIRDVEITVQINADSVLDPDYKKVMKKLLSGKYNVILGSDSHNCTDRAPRITEALQYINDNFGSDAKRRVENKTLSTFNKIVNEGKFDA